MHHNHTSFGAAGVNPNHSGADNGSTWTPGGSTSTSDNTEVSWGGHPDYVDALLQQEQLGSRTIDASALLNPTFSQQGLDQNILSTHSWLPQESKDLASGSSYPPLDGLYDSAMANQSPPIHIDPRLGSSGASMNWEDSILDPGGQTSVIVDDYSYHPPALFMPALPLAPHPRLPKEGWTQAQHDMLIRGRQAGQGFEEISNELREKLGVEITPNALVKRFHKIQETHLGPLSTAINNAKPDIMACIKVELEKLGSDTLPQADKQALDEIMQDFHRSIPKLVQNRVYRKRKAAQSFSLSHRL